MFNNIFLKFVPFMGQSGKLWYGTAEQATEGNMAHALFLLDN
jgi:hypothetical protein